jgi:dimethylglycine catabolism B
MTVRLPLADTHARELETCGFCPKLCRATCSVSNAEPSESLTPWGKMSLAWLTARGDLPLEESVMKTAWACCGCRACSDFCELGNPVSDTLLAARATYREHGHELPSAEQSYERFQAFMADLPVAGPVSGDTLLVLGCSYSRHLPEVAREAVDVATRLLGPVEPWRECCGLFPRQVGDRAAADAARRRLEERAGGRPVVALDAGCALELGAPTLLDLAAERLDRLGPVPALRDRARVRYHDPCRRRGQNVHEAPRAVLRQALGRDPDEFERKGRQAACSGGGGLLPLTYPEVSRSIAAERLSEHERLGGGIIVTACASSLRRFRASGAEALDITSVLAASLAGGGSSG